MIWQLSDALVAAAKEEVEETTTADARRTPPGHDTLRVSVSTRARVCEAGASAQLHYSQKTGQNDDS